MAVAVLLGPFGRPGCVPVVREGCRCASHPGAEVLSVSIHGVRVRHVTLCQSRCDGVLLVVDGWSVGVVCCVFVGAFLASTASN